MIISEVPIVDNDHLDFLVLVLKIDFRQVKPTAVSGNFDTEFTDLRSSRADI